MIQIHQHGLVTHPATVAALRDEYTARRCALVRQMLEPALLERLLQAVDVAHVHERTDTAKDGAVVAKELRVESAAIVSRMFALLFNTPALFRCIEQLTGCSTIGHFTGRIYMMQPDSNHHDSWHDDNNGNRLVGVSVNLSRTGYSGGQFRIRERASDHVLAEIHNIVPGDAHLFRIAPELEHCVAPVTGTATKIAYAGWFETRAKQAAAPTLTHASVIIP